MKKVKNIIHDRSVASYMKDISGINPLTKDEEYALWEKYKYENNISARDQLINSNLKFVANVAKKFQGLGLSYSDLISEGNIGLIESMEKFDGTKGNKVITYSVWWIRQAILDALEKRNVISNDEFVTEGCTYDNPDEDEPNENDISEEKPLTNKELTIAVNVMLGALEPKEKDIVTMYYGIGGKPKTLEEIGKKYGITKERVRQINEKALKKMRAISMNDIVKEIIED